MQRKLSVLLILCLFLCLNLGIASGFENKEITTKILPTDLQYQYDVKWYFLNLHVENNTTYIRGDVTIKAEIVSEILDTFSFHLYNTLYITKIEVDGNEKNFTQKRYEVLVPGLNVSKGQLISVKIYYEGIPPSKDFFFSGMNTRYDSENGFNVTWTLSEPNNAYEWFPVKQDLSDKADSAWIFITTSAENKVASNGILENVVQLPENKVRYEWKTRYPIDYYLISLAVAEYQDYSFKMKIPGVEDSLLIQNYIYNDPEYLRRNKAKIDIIKDMILFLSEIYGVYPFHKEKYGHASAPLYGAMEHQTMTTTRNFEEWLILHELAHQWFGDYITCSSWEYIWLNEGFASYSEFLWDEYAYGRDSAISVLRESKINDVIENGKNGSVYISKDSVNSPRFIFSGTLTYNKGPILIHMLRFYLDDDELFFDVLKTYMKRFGGQSASVNDFIEVLEEISGKEFSTFFDQWYYGEGYPIFQITWNQDEENIKFSSEQSTTNSKTAFFETPFEVKVSYSNGTEEIKRFRQEQNAQVFISEKNQKGVEIDSITFDPNQWLLAEHTVEKGTVSLNRINSESKDISVYPNPTRDFINIYFNGTLGLSKDIHLINNEGSIISCNQIDNDNYTINMESFSSGVYFILIQCQGRFYVEKIIKYK